MTGKRGKDRKEKNLASSQDRVSRDSHHHGSSGIPLVRHSCVCRWWGSPQFLCASVVGFSSLFGHMALYKVFGKIVLQAMARTPRSPSPMHAFFLFVLAPAGRGRCWCLGIFSTTKYPSSNSLESCFWAAVYSLSGLHLAGPHGNQAVLQNSFDGLPGGPTGSLANKL